MIRHKKIYKDHFNLSEQDFVACEICGDTAVDIHHIQSRGMGGTSKLSSDNIENLMALCRKHHNMCGASIEYNQSAKKIHLEFLKLKAHG
jgi:predicted restriction endonuclease